MNIHQEIEIHITDSRKQFDIHTQNTHSNFTHVSVVTGSTSHIRTEEEQGADN